MIFSKGTKSKEYSTPKYKSNQSPKQYGFSLSSSLDSKIGAARMKNTDIGATIMPEKIKSNASFSL